MGRTTDFAFAATVATFVVQQHFFAVGVKADRIRRTGGTAKLTASPLLLQTKAVKVRSQLSVRPHFAAKCAGLATVCAFAAMVAGRVIDLQHRFLILKLD